MRAEKINLPKVTKCLKKVFFGPNLRTVRARSWQLRSIMCVLASPQSMSIGATLWGEPFGREIKTTRGP
jgi:hypothetical protein